MTMIITLDLNQKSIRIINIQYKVNNSSYYAFIHYESI